MIDKKYILVQLSGADVSDSDGNKLARRYITFEGNRELEYIKTVYEQFWLSPSGKEFDKVIKTYFVKDLPAEYDENGIETVAESTQFTTWYSQLGATVIVPAINATLAAMSPDVESGYNTQP